MLFWSYQLSCFGITILHCSHKCSLQLRKGREAPKICSPWSRCTVLLSESYLGKNSENLLLLVPTQMVEILISNDVQNISSSHTVAIWFY